MLRVFYYFWLFSNWSSSGQPRVRLNSTPHLYQAVEPRQPQLSTVKIRCVKVETLTLADIGFRLASKQVDIAQTRKSINLCEISFPRPTDSSGTTAKVAALFGVDKHFLFSFFPNPAKLRAEIRLSEAAGAVNHLTNLWQWVWVGGGRRRGGWKKKRDQMPTSLYSDCSLLSEIIFSLQVIQRADDKANYNCHLPSACVCICVCVCDSTDAWGRWAGQRVSLTISVCRRRRAFIQKMPDISLIRVFFPPPTTSTTPSALLLLYTFGNVTFSRQPVEKLDLRDGGRRGEGVREVWGGFHPPGKVTLQPKVPIMWREYFSFNPAQIYYNLEIQQKSFWTFGAGSTI